MGLLVHARNARQKRGADLRKHVRNRIRIGTERDREAGVGAPERHQPPEVVRERQIEQHQIVAEREVLDPLDARGHRVVVAVADHAALRRAGRSRRVDVGVEVVLADHRLCRGERLWVLLGERDPLGAQLVQRVERQDVGEPKRLDLLALSLVLDERADGIGVIEYVSGLFGPAARINGRRDRADAGEREVEQGPFEPRAADDPEGVALSDPAPQQTLSELLDCAGRLVPRNLAPAAGLGLDEICGAGAFRSDRVAPEPRDRPLPHGRDFRRGADFRFSADSCQARHSARPRR